MIASLCNKDLHYELYLKTQDNLLRRENKQDETQVEDSCLCW